jgi:hypothetical protein
MGLSSRRRRRRRSSLMKKNLTHLEKRFVANVDSDDQALQVLGFHIDIYYMLGHLGWVQFSNGMSVNTHKEFVLKIS